MRRLFVFLGWAVAVGAATAAGVSCSGDTEQSQTGGCPAPCPPGQSCVDGVCVAGGGGSGGSGGQGGGITFTTGGSGGGCPSGEPMCGGECCYPGEHCALDLACAPVQDPCTGSDDCWFDTYCLNGECIPYGVPPGHDHDETCENQIDIDAIVPAEQCRWTGPPPSDPYPGHYHVMSTPVVVDFDFESNPSILAPSIVFTTFPTAGSYSNPGVLRIINGADCSQQFSFNNPADATMSPASVAVGDLNADGRAEIVAAAHGGGLLAFHYDGSTFTRLWRSGTCGGSGTTPDYTGGSDQWSGPSIHDLDDDGLAEVIYGATVYSGTDGCIRSSSLGYPSYHKGIVPVIADVDEDGVMELVLANGVYHWDALSSDWILESYATAATGLSAGQVAVADFGYYPIAALGDQDRPEIAVVSSGTVRVQTIAGTVIFGPLAIPGGGNGGLPTIADFDGDGQREFASAGGSQYVVFDFGCTGSNPQPGCLSNGVLWTQPSKDQSSNVTGSSVFDFDANGSAEAVYADECFLRIYEGATGTVLFSAARSSGTTYENPVIVDADGDYRTEIVSAVNDYAGTLGCPATDPLYPSAPFAVNHGIVVLRDELDRWAASRPVWNQHAYAVTHVGNLGETPPSSQVGQNWNDAALNNFRQNVQGDLDALGEPDLTAGGDVGAVQCNGSIATIEARVCNRGTLPMVSGTVVAFYEGSADGPELCRAPIPIALAVGECLTVSCEADIGGQTIDVFVKVDPDGESSECYENNNAALYQGVACGLVPH